MQTARADIRADKRDAKIRGRTAEVSVGRLKNAGR
jgi:hypothetical protein